MTMTRQDQKRILGHFVMAGIAFLVTQFYLVIAESPVGDRIESALLSSFFALRGPREVPKTVTIVKVDTRSYRRLGLKLYQAIPPEMFAEAIEKINTAKPKLIVLDYLFDDKFGDDAGNKRFQDALKTSPSIIGSAEANFIDTDLTGKHTIETEPLRPHEFYASAVKAVVPFTVRPEGGVLKRLTMSDDILFYPHLKKVPLLKPLRRFVSPSIKDPGDYALINFYGPSYTLPGIPFYKLIKSNPPAEYFKDRIVFIGGVDFPGGKEGKDDSFITPASSAPIWGVEILATIASNLLDGTWIRRAAPNTEQSVLVVLVSTFSFILPYLGLYWGFITFVALGAAWFSLSYYSFSRLFFFVPGATAFGVVLPLYLVILTIWSSFNLRRILAEKKPDGR